jgi:hypothetical protein
MEQQNDNLHEHPIRFYGKSELAALYIPNCDPESAKRSLIRWINRNTELTQKLKEIGYDKKRHFFFSKEVELIFHYLGRP